MSRRRKPKEVHVHHYGRRDRQEKTRAQGMLIFGVVGAGIGALVGGPWGAGIGAVMASGVASKIYHPR